jgi:hypothetical protein
LIPFPKPGSESIKYSILETFCAFDVKNPASKSTVKSRREKQFVLVTCSIIMNNHSNG